MADQELTFKIIGDASSAKKALEDLGMAVEDVTKKTKEKNKDLVDTVKEKWLEIAGVIGTVKFAFDFSKEYAREEQQFNAMSKQFGVNAQNMIDSLTRVTKGTVEDGELIQGASRAMALGVTRDTEKMATMYQFARIQGQALGTSTQDTFNMMVDGVGKGSDRMLKSLGISTKGWEDQAKSLGLVYDKQFIFNKLMEEAEKKIKIVGDVQLTSAERFDQMNVSIKNIQDSIGEALLPLMEGIVKAVKTAADIFNSFAPPVRTALVSVTLGITTASLAMKIFGISLMTTAPQAAAAAGGINLVTIATKALNAATKINPFAILVTGIAIAVPLIVANFSLIQKVALDAISFIKIGAMELGKIILTAINFVPVIAGINLVIEGINKITGKSIPTIKSVTEDATKTLNILIDNEYEAMQERDKNYKEMVNKKAVAITGGATTETEAAKKVTRDLAAENKKRVDDYMAKMQEQIDIQKKAGEEVKRFSENFIGEIVKGGMLFEDVMLDVIANLVEQIGSQLSSELYLEAAKAGYKAIAAAIALQPAVAAQQGAIAAMYGAGGAAITASAMGFAQYIRSSKSTAGGGFADGGMIDEPITGVGRSGRSYSFGENGSERIVPQNTTNNNDYGTNINFYNNTFQNGEDVMNLFRRMGVRLARR